MSQTYRLFGSISTLNPFKMYIAMTIFNALKKELAVGLISFFLNNQSLNFTINFSIQTLRHLFIP